MLSQTYSKKFIKSDKNNQGLESVMTKIINKEQEYNKPCLEWNLNEIETFLKDLGSVSPMTISRNLMFLRNFVKFIGENEQIEVPEFKLDRGKLYDLVDYNKLMNTVLSYEQYRHIKNQLDLNARDKLVFELAWSLLDSREIKNLREEDITYSEDENGMEIAFLNIEGRTNPVRIQDPEVVEDIKKCDSRNHIKYEPNYGVNSKDGKIKTLKYRDTEYLIKPVKVGRSKADVQLANPSFTLNNALRQQEVICPGIEIEEISVESIKRSKIIYLLAPQNERYFDKYLISNMLDATNVDGNLHWLKRVAQIKYANH